MLNKRKQVFLRLAGALGFLAQIGSGQAADMSPPAPSPTVFYTKAPVTRVDHDWTGFYAGLNLGYGWGRQDTALSIFDDPLSIGCHFCFPDSVTTVKAAGAPTIRPQGLLGGIQGGYNRQFGSWLIGVEADFNWMSMRRTANTTSAPFTDADTDHLDPAFGNFKTRASIDWLSTIRGRVGHAFGDVLLFATGGAAVTRVSYTQSYSDNTTDSASETASFAATRWGWSAGTGIEYALTDNWSVKGEYLHAGFGHLGGQVDGPVSSRFGTTTTTFTHGLRGLSVDMVRAGVSYRFNGF